jgi:hypothetical protein
MHVLKFTSVILFDSKSVAGLFMPCLPHDCICSFTNLFAQLVAVDVRTSTRREFVLLCTSNTLSVRDSVALLHLLDFLKAVCSVSVITLHHLLLVVLEGFSILFYFLSKFILFSDGWVVAFL